MHILIADIHRALRERPEPNPYDATVSFAQDRGIEFVGRIMDETGFDFDKSTIELGKILDAWEQESGLL